MNVIVKSFIRTPVYYPNSKNINQYFPLLTTKVYKVNNMNKAQSTIWIVIIILVLAVVGVGVFMMGQTSSPTSHVISAPMQQLNSSVQNTVDQTPPRAPAPAAAVVPTVTLTTAPTSSIAGQQVSINWHIDSDPASIRHSAVHFGPNSVPSPKGPGDYPSASQYLCTDVACSIPGDFATTIGIAKSGTYYYRAHAVIGGQNYWSDEKTITIQAQPPPAPQMSSSDYKVRIENMAFSPQTITIEKGESISWTNYDSAPHTVSSDSGTELQSNTLAKGDTYRHTFNTAGTYTYHCNVHPGMKATVIVLDSASGYTSSSMSSSGSTYY
jgi:plastocyanin